MLTKLGIGEIIVVLVVVLLFVGPEKLPQVGRMAGRALRDIKRYMNDMTKELKDSSSELKSVCDEMDEMGKDLTCALKTTGEKIVKDIEASSESTEAENAQEKLPDSPTPIKEQASTPKIDHSKEMQTKENQNV